MKYIIHSTVIFDTTKYLLTLITNANSSIKLSNSSGQILEELIKYQKTCEPITREHLFSKVWRNHGLEPSHGNLNQQISLIRKSLNFLGIDPTTIITIPKRGLKLNNQISIKIMDENTQNIISPESNINYNNNKTSWFSTLHLSKINIRPTIILVTLIIAILITSISYLYIKDKNFKKFYPCKQINACNICTFHQTPNLECNELSFKIPENNQTHNIDSYHHYYTTL